MRKVVVVIGAGSIGQAIARRVGAGKHVVLADLRQANADAAAGVMRDAGFHVSTAPVDVSSRQSVHALVETATSFGEVTGLIHAAGVSPSQAPPETILAVDLYGTAVVLEQFGNVIAGGAGVVPAASGNPRAGSGFVPNSVQAQHRFLDLLTATGCEVAVDANASEPSFLQYSKLTDVVRGRSRVQWTFGSLGKKNLKCCARDAFPPLRSVHPVRHLRPIVDSEGRDRSSDCSVDIDDSVRDACIGPQAGHPVEKRAAIGLILGCEGCHSDRLRIRHLLVDGVEIPVLERSQRDVHLGDDKGVGA